MHFSLVMLCKITPKKFPLKREHRVVTVYFLMTFSFALPTSYLLLSFDFQGQVWGVAYKVSKQNVERALGELYEREISLGGYQLLQLSFSCKEKPSHTFVVMVYIATPENPHYLGPATPEQLVTEIASAEGHAGHNAEYVIRLADFMREKVPDFEEEHLFELEKLLRKELGLCTKTNAPWRQLEHNFK